jgi:hypothetical protein
MLIELIARNDQQNERTISERAEPQNINTKL